MAVSLSVIAAKDSAGTAIAAGLQAQDKSGTGAGPFTLGQILIDGVAGTNMAQVTAANAVKVDGSAVTQPVSLTSTTITGTVAATQSGTWTVQPGNTANTTAWKVDGSAVTQPVSIASLPSGAVTNAGTFAVQVTSAPSTAVTNAGTFAVQVSNANANGQAVMASSAPVALATDQKYQTGMSPRAFSVAFSTLTRPANTTAYTALDSISDNATAGSVTALTATVSDTNSDPLTITEILISSTDTGLAGKKIRAYLFNSDPTASTGVGAGDNTAYSQKKAGYIGSMSGLLETGFSDGTVGRLVPSYADGAASPLSNAGANGFIVSAPSAAGKALWIQYQAIDGFTPSASSTTIIGTVRGFQGRAS